MKNSSKYEKKSLSYDDIEGDSLDIPDNLFDTSVNIKPEFYIHMGLINIQKTYLKENAEAGFMQFWVFVEHIESLCDAANMIDKEGEGSYYDKIKEYKETEEYKNADKEIIRNVRLANFKLKLLMGYVFSSRVIDTPLRL